MKDLEEMYFDMAKLMQEDSEKFEEGIERFDSKLFRLEDKTLMLQFNLVGKVEDLNAKVKKQIENDIIQQENVLIQ